MRLNGQADHDVSFPNMTENMGFCFLKLFGKVGRDKKEKSKVAYGFMTMT